jgi:hypothetical protein
MKTHIDVMPEAMSLIIIASFLFHLSTKAPAIGLMMAVGAKLNRETRANAVASPVFYHAQMLRANWLMYVPNRLRNWPDQMNAKRRIPVNWSLPPVLA